MFRRLVSRNVFYWTRNFWGRMIGSGEMSRRYAQGSTLQGLRLALLVVGASAGAGCFSSKECSSVGCLTPIVVTATLRGTVPGMHKATFCKRGQCESALLDLLAPSEATVDGPLFVRFVSEPTDHGLIITASVLGAPSFEDGESLSFTGRYPRRCRSSR